MSDPHVDDSNPHHFDDALSLVPVGDPADGLSTGRTTQAYRNMVGPYGGITAAILVAAVQQHPACRGEPLALSVNYAGPIDDGEFEVQAVPVRTNRSSQHWTLAVRQAGGVTTTATALVGARRPTWASDEIAVPEAPPMATLPPMPSALPLPWLHSYDLRYVTGGVPDPAAGIEQEQSVSTLWARSTPPRPLDFPGLAAYCDVFYPRVFLRLGRWLAAGTVTYTVYFHADAAVLAEQGDREVLASARGQGFRGGYFDQVAQVWDTAGRLLATGHQLVYFKP